MKLKLLACISFTGIIVLSTVHLIFINVTYQDRSYCAREGSMTNIAETMSHMSSPFRSQSWNASRRILAAAMVRNATINCFLPGLFRPLYGNIKRMMNDVGVATKLVEYRRSDRPRFADSRGPPNKSPAYFVLETSFYGGLKHWGWYCDEADYPCYRIILNSEQFDGFLANRSGLTPYLLRCAKNPNCVVWEYSTLNYNKMRTHPFLKSAAVQLLPVMHQPISLHYSADHFREPHAFTPSSSFVNAIKQQMPPLIPLHRRPIDVVFLGILTSRRKILVGKIESRLPFLVNSSRSVFMSGEHNISVRQKIYSNAKICLNIHSSSAETPAEFHRISEMAPFGCVLLSETLVEQIGLDAYQSCGGIRMSSFENIPDVIGEILHDINQTTRRQLWQESQLRTHRWWMEAQAWPVEILNRIFLFRLHRPLLKGFDLFGYTFWIYPSS